MRTRGEFTSRGLNAWTGTDGKETLVEDGLRECKAEEANRIPASGDRVVCDEVDLALTISCGRGEGAGA